MFLAPAVLNSSISMDSYVAHRCVHYFCGVEMLKMTVQSTTIQPFHAAVPVVKWCCTNDFPRTSNPDPQIVEPSDQNSSQ